MGRLTSGTVFRPGFGPLEEKRLETTVAIEIKDLGWMNGWNLTPSAVTECAAMRKTDRSHVLEFAQAGRCASRVTCRTCGYTYRVDSSD